MATLTYSVCSVLLLGFAARIYWRHHRGLEVPSTWLQVARAVAGAGAFSILALLHQAAAVKIGCWSWNPTWGGEPTAGDIAAWVTGFLLVSTAVVCMLLKLWPQHRLLSAAGAEPARRWAAFRLLGGLAVALYVPWGGSHDLGPEVLGYAGFRGWIGYSGFTCEPRPPDAVALLWLALLSGVTLVLWFFQHFWGRAMSAREGTPSP
jgi:hypothetical protein